MYLSSMDIYWYVPATQICHRPVHLKGMFLVMSWLRFPIWTGIVHLQSCSSRLGPGKMGRLGQVVRRDWEFWGASKRWVMSPRKKMWYYKMGAILSPSLIVSWCASSCFKRNQILWPPKLSIFPDGQNLVILEVSCVFRRSWFWSTMSSTVKKTIVWGTSCSSRKLMDLHGLSMDINGGSGLWQQIPAGHTRTKCFPMFSSLSWGDVEFKAVIVRHSSEVRDPESPETGSVLAIDRSTN